MSVAKNNDDLLVVKDLVKHFPVRKGAFGKETGKVRAVDGVSFSIPRGKTLSLVGESGCGKTTTGRLVLRLLEATSGSVTFDGIDVGALDRRGLRKLRTRMQLIFQDPFASLNPRMSVRSIISEALIIHKIGNGEERRQRVLELLHLVGLPEESAARYPHEFSGGQRQRIGIARALAVEPSLIVADEPVSALDVSIQAQILNLMKELQERLGLTYLFVGHDLSVIEHISDYVAVMYLGRIVEFGTIEDVFDNPTHPYTRALFSAVPVAHPRDRRTHRLVRGDVPSPMAPPPGCHYHPRCPDATPECSSAQPRLTTLKNRHQLACHVHGPSRPDSKR